MRGQEYKARDKIVRKMHRDGLMEKNLRSGEVERVSQREADYRISSRSMDDTKIESPYQEMMQEDTGRGEDYQGQFRTGAFYGAPYRRGIYIPVSSTGNYRGRKSKRKERNLYGEADAIDPVPETIPDSQPNATESDTMSDPASNNVQDAEGGTPSQGMDTDLDWMHGGQFQSSSAGENGEHLTVQGDSSGLDAGLEQEDLHDRKKKQVYTHSQKENEQKKLGEAKENYALKEKERLAGNKLAVGQAEKNAKPDAGKKASRKLIYKEQEKKNSRLKFEKEKGKVRSAAMGLIALTEAGIQYGDAAENQGAMDEDAVSCMGNVGGKTARYALRQASIRMQKRGGAESVEAARKKAARHAMQKKRIKKAYADAKKAAKEADTIWEKAKGIASAVVGKKKAILLAVAFTLLFFVFLGAGLSSCSAMVQGTSSTFIGTTYPSEDEDIYDAEAAYKELEEALDEQINSMEDTHPGYDEYRYQVDEITHNPYQLISFLTVLYEEFTYDQVKDILPELFAEQYRLTLEEVIETRTRIETQIVPDPVTGEETEQEIEVEYEWHVLCICLTNKGFDTVARSHMTQEQAAHYTAYNFTYGNRSYLFDITGIPTDSPGGSGYEIPKEALSDEQFARMIQEAEKYLGRAYVWGGASPETGFDCSGFVSWVINNSGNGWDVGRQTAEGLRGNCTYVSPSEAKPGDLIFFQGTYNTTGASHVGIYAGDGMMIHAGNPVKYSNINTPYWKGHFLAYGRIG